MAGGGGNPNALRIASVALPQSPLISLNPPK